jgi:hypothetical protein
MTGPVSQVLEQEILGELRRQGIIVWLDKDSSYTRFVDGLAARLANGEISIPVAGFRGSFLELLFALEPYGSELDRKPLLVHMPGFNEESIRKTPLLELYEAGVRFRKSLDTLIREAANARIAPDEVERFLAGQPTLEAADAWLETSISRSSFGLAAALAEIGPKLLVEAMSQPASALALRVTAPAEAEILATYLHRLTGMDTAWIEPFAKIHPGPLDPLLHALEAWMLCVEYVHDLKREPHRQDLRRLRDLSQPLINASRDLVTAVRRDHGDAYEHMADVVAGLFKDELDAMTPDELGQIDTFREEEERVLEGAIEALHRRDWPRAKAWWEARKGENSFWLQRDQPRRWAWMLVAKAAQLGEILERHAEPFAGARSLEEAVERYTTGAWEVDRAHRTFEQIRLALLESRLPHYGDLREVATELRRAHRTWADRLTRACAALCQEHGFLPPAAMQQRNLFEQAVLPLLSGGEKLALFVIDAFRYEMAAELMDELAGSGTVVDLKPRLAELPTITAVGMNALAPVAEAGRLTVAGVFKGFKSRESTVRSPEDRARAMGYRAGGKPALLLKLAEVGEKSTAELTRSLKPHQLVLVHSREIDDAGEANVGLPTFESTLRQITAAWHHLQLAGVKNAIFTADHGFLVQDETTEKRNFGKKTDPQRRHVLDEYPRAEEGMVHVSLASLGYDGLTGYLLFRNDTAVFSTGTAGATFVHGGLSPQERIIPVLTISRKHREQAVHVAYVVETMPLDDVMGHHRLRVRVIHAPGTLAFAAARHIDIALRVPGREEIHVIIKDVSGPGKFRAGRLHMPAGEEWTEVFFGLEGPVDERVRLEIHHADNTQNVTGAAPETWYTVSGTTADPPRELMLPPSSTWEQAIADEGIRRVFLHIEKHGAITEPEVTHLLGSPRAFRRFSLEFDEHLPKLPFGVRIETGEGGKRYVREENR